MPTRRPRRIVMAALSAPLLLTLAACGSGGGGDGAAVTGEPIARIAPPEGRSWEETIAKTDEGGFRMGNPDAPIKLIEYGSLTCPHCADFAANAEEELRGTFVESGRVSFEFRNFVMNPLDLTMAMIVRCGAPESFFALTSQTFKNQQSLIEAWGSSGEQAAQQAANLPPEQRYAAMADLAGLYEFYGARGIAADQARQCLADAAAAETLVNNTSTQSSEFDITGTPTFLLNGRKLDGNTWPEIKTSLENAGAR